tara:strand:+ start:304 stop:579 length:276 start_codon:yes stop_codon:yes gene_type:complete
MRYHTDNGHYLTPDMLAFRLELIQHAGEALRKSLDNRLGKAQDDLILIPGHSDRDKYRNGDQIRAQICADVIDSLRVKVQEKYEKRAIEHK